MPDFLKSLYGGFDQTAEGIKAALGIGGRMPQAERGFQQALLGGLGAASTPFNALDEAALEAGGFVSEEAGRAGAAIDRAGMPALGSAVGVGGTMLGMAPFIGSQLADPIPGPADNALRASRTIAALEKSGIPEAAIQKARALEALHGEEALAKIVAEYEGKGVPLFSYDLPMDEASRIARARGMGFDEAPWYHGSTHVFDRFHDKGNIENWGGKYPHLSNDIEDVEINYAGEGPDLTNRIQRRAEQMTDDTMPDEAAREAARRELAGPSKGHILPLQTRATKPINVGSWDPTYLDFSPRMDTEGEFVGDSKLAEKLYAGLQGASNKYGGVDVEQTMGDLSDLLYDEVSANDLDLALRRSEGLSYAEAPSGDMASSQIIADLYKKLGFDAIDVNAKERFPGMAMADDTQHRVVFSPQKIRSTFAAFDPRMKDSRFLLALRNTAAPLGGLWGASQLGNQPQEQ